MLPPILEPSGEETEEVSGGVDPEKDPEDIGELITDMLAQYKMGVQDVVTMPRRFRQLLLDHIPRIEAKRQILDSAVAMYPHISQDDREQQMGIWKRMAKILGFAGSFLHQVLYEGTVGEDVPSGLIVAENWETVVDFFTKKTGLLSGEA